jgi:GT2 family glycosyltransferase
MKIGIVIPVLNNLKYLRALVPTIASAQHELSVYVIDNGSTDPTLEFLTDQARVRSDFHFEHHPRPLGVAAAWNRGVRAAIAGGSDLVYILNSDVLLHPHTIDNLVRYFLANRFELVCSPDIRFIPEISFDHALAEPLTPESIHRAWQALRQVQIPQIQHGRSYRTDIHDHPTLFAFLFDPHRMTREVGWFDESLVKCYFEDVDYCWRLILAGGDISVSKESPVLHFENRSILEGGVTLEHWKGNHDYFMAKHLTSTTSLEEAHRRRATETTGTRHSPARTCQDSGAIQNVLSAAFRASTAIPIAIHDGFHHIEPRSRGFNVFAFASGNFGLATAARNTIDLLEQNGHPLKVWDITTGDSRSGQVHSVRATGGAASCHLPHAVNLFHLNPHEMQLLLPTQFPALAYERRLNVAIPFWELTVLPRRWIAVLREMDVILAPTRFILETLTRALPDNTVLHFPQAVSIPESIRPDRSRFDLPPDRVVFLNAFDMGSDIQRKNPWGAIRAFQMAFSADAPANLVIKINNPSLHSTHARPLAELRAAAASDPRIRLIEEPLNHLETLTLLASCDVIVSLHRSEGLGLVPMEGMALGRPVILTAWSGVMDFANDGNSCLVPFDLVPIVATIPEYQYLAPLPGAVWAEPRLADAARWMQTLFNDPELRARIGRQAAADMATRNNPSRGSVFVELLNHPLACGERSLEQQRTHILRRLRVRELQELYRRSIRHVVLQPEAIPARAFQTAAGITRKLRRFLKGSLRS